MLSLGADATTWVQKTVCLAERTCQDCENYSLPVGVCQYVHTGGSMIVASCTDNGVVTRTYSGMGCSGAYDEETQPVKKCEWAQENLCTADASTVKDDH